jgi:uncharacterized protein (DUF2249 family)
MPEKPTDIVTLDVRDDIREGREPFRRIMDAVARLRDGERLRLIAPFEPRPLIGVLTAQGFATVVTALGDGAYEVILTPPAQRDPDGGLLD